MDMKLSRYGAHWQTITQTGDKTGVLSLSFAGTFKAMLFAPLCRFHFITPGKYRQWKPHIFERMDAYSVFGPPLA